LSILTKIFVVLATVLSILLVALLVPFVQNTQKIKDANVALTQERDVAKADAALARRNLVDAEEAKTDAEKGFRAEKEQLVAQASNLMNQLTAKERDIVQAQGALTQAQSRLGELASAQEQSGKIITALNDEVKQRRDETLDLRTKNIALSDRVNELQTQNETLVQQIRLVKEQMFDLQQRVEQIADASATGTPQATGAQQSRAATTAVVKQVAVAAPTNPVRGMITDVRQVGEITFVALNVGSNDQVREGMQFIVHEGQKFLGNVVITKVDLNSSAGRVTLAQGPIKANQQVLTGGF
jgi:chromosome segregation ATPase